MLFSTPGMLANMSQVKVDQIESVYKFKYLGLKLDTHLNFSEHVSYTKGKILPKLKLLGRLSYSLETDPLLSLYKTLILPVLDFGDLIYHRMTQGDADILQRLQNIAYRAILKVDIYAQRTPQRCDNVATTLGESCGNIGSQRCDNVIL